MAFATLTINIAKIKANIAKIRTRIPEKTNLLLIAKANAYGLGVVDICKGLNGQLDYIGVATMTEALEIRQANINTPILLLSEPMPAEWQQVTANDITITVYEKETIQEIDKYATKHNQTIKTHLKIDTGMTRLGTPWETSEQTIASWLASSDQIIKEGIYSHFANSDISHELNNTQLERFINQTKPHSRSIKHLANSDGVSNIQNSHFDLVRIGLNAYQNSFTLTAPIRKLQFAKKGTAVGYGSTYITDEDCYVGVVGIGYADGISTQYSNKGFVTINQQNYPIIGKICMDMFMIKLPASTSVSTADKAIIISPDDEPGMTISEMASITDQNPREIMTRFSKRIKRIITT